jgi:bifunctional non-homologous end joining protein LigD
MLAASGPIKGDASAWAFEPKLDGWRVLVTVHTGRVAVRTRNGRDATESVPELGAIADAMAGRAVVLDGELVAHQGRAEDFYGLGARMMARHPLAKARATPIAFVAFDVLWLDGDDLTHRPYTERRAALDGLALQGDRWCTVPSYPGDGAELFKACTELGLEGLVAKRLTSRYRPGERSPDWVKAKTVEWKEQHAWYRHEH